jgi:HD-GYP domain-containing protein (c-di-GMP phosphodiesterase class II)
LGYAGLLHDAEKVRIPIDLLSKDTGFNAREEEIVREHPRLAFEKLRDFEYDVVREIVVAHHEYKSDPYPRKGTDRRKKSRSSTDRRQNNAGVPRLAQLVAIADMFDALISNRSYKESLSKSKTEIILRNQFTGDHKYIDQVLLRYNP